MALKKCARCMAVGYCGKACQTQAWRQHKRECGKSGGAGGDAASTPLPE
jgi:ferredoxin